MTVLTRRLPMTRIKLFIAGVLYRFLRPFLGAGPRVIRRAGVTYEVDLSEAIDFTLFLAGGFQSYVFDTPLVRLPEDGVVLDVGANIGSMTFAFARKVPRGKVLAFEPTDGTFRRFMKNLSLNPSLAERVVPVQAFLSETSSEKHGLTAFSSWKIDGRREGSHPLHGGSLQPAPGVPAFALDDVAAARNLSRVDLIKIDTEGHELSVLRGARKTLARFRPPIVFELGLYTLKERGLSLSEYFEALDPLGYRWTDMKTGETVTAQNADRILPLRSTTDILAVSDRAG